MTGTEKKSIKESRDLVTGFDEIAIEKQFKTHIDDLRLADIVRSLVWLDQTRAGIEKKAAYDAVMNMTQVALYDHFLDEEEDDGGDQGDNEFAVMPAGKDVTPDAEQPTSRPPGASSPVSHLTSTGS